MQFKTFITVVAGILMIQSSAYAQILSPTLTLTTTPSLANTDSLPTTVINPDSVSKTLSLPSSTVNNIITPDNTAIKQVVSHEPINDTTYPVDVSIPNPPSTTPIDQPVGLDPATQPNAGLSNFEFQQSNSSLWDRIRKGFAIPNLDTPLAANKTVWYANQPEYMKRMTERGKQYLFYIVEELERRNMPSEIALLPFVESAFNPQAISSAKAAGIWQFMPATGKNFNLKQNVWRDERRGVIESTRAALNYLQKLHGMFGDWHLALAAYNWGEGSVQRAINKNRAKGLSTDYLSLNMPLETSHYVPKFQAIKNIIKNPDVYGIQLTPLSNTPYFTTVTKDRDIDVSLAAQFAGMSLNEFKALNPSFKKPVILGAHRPEILLPTDRVSLFNESLSNYKGSLSSWTTITLSGTERPTDLARRYGVNERILRDVNNIPARMLLKPGSTLIVPKVNPSVQTGNISGNLDNATIKLAPELVRRSLKVYKKDTWIKIANRANLSVSQLQQWNRGVKLRPGVELTYYAAHNAPAVVAPPEPIEMKSSKNGKKDKEALKKAGSKTNKTNKTDKLNESKKDDLKKNSKQSTKKKSDKSDKSNKEKSSVKDSKKESNSKKDSNNKHSKNKSASDKR